MTKFQQLIITLLVFGFRAGWRWNNEYLIVADDRGVAMFVRFPSALKRFDETQIIP